MFHNNKHHEAGWVGIDDDGDDVELIEDFEAVFGVTFSDEDAESIVTLGDALEIICSKLPTDQKQQCRCLTAMAYYRLNRALCDNGKINLTRRVEVPRGQSPKSFQRQLEQKTGLRLDFLTEESRWVSNLALSQLVTWIAAPIFFSGFSAMLVGVVLIAITHTLWRLADRLDNRIWLYDGTLGDLSRQASEINIGKLVSSGGKWTKPDIWKTMTSIIRETTGFPRDNMTPEMRFIQLTPCTVYVPLGQI